MGFTISDYFTANNQDPDGATVLAYRVFRFDTPPVQNSAPPGGGADAGPVVTSKAFGGPGAFQIDVPTNEDYYVSVLFGGQLYWKFYNWPGGSGSATIDYGLFSSRPPPTTDGELFGVEGGSLHQVQNGTWTPLTPYFIPADYGETS